MEQNEAVKVLVSGCFDMLHSGHIAFLRSAAALGNLYVCIGSDATVFGLKQRYPVNTQDERKYHLEALRDVHEVCISTGSGYLDFLPELERIQPDMLVVNEDGDRPEKADLCKAKGIRYVVLQREPFTGLPVRSTTSLRQVNQIPYRIDLAGGWLDQPFVSCHTHGPVITVSIEPTHDFDERSGMATSTRKVATALWHHRLPQSNSEPVAKMLFASENPPGTKEVAGSQDSIGIVYAGLTRSFYEGEYWPVSIACDTSEEILKFIEDHLYLVRLGSRDQHYHVLEGTRITEAGAKALADAANECWEAALKKDLKAFGVAIRKSFEAQIAMFPSMVDDPILKTIAQYQDKAAGWKISGAGGGGYLILVSDQPIENSIKVTLRRKEDLI